MKSITSACSSDDSLRTFQFVPRAINIALFSYYNPKFKASERLVFEKLITLQLCFGNKQFQYTRARFVNELGLGKETIRNVLNSFENKGYISIHRFKKANEHSYGYKVDFSAIANDVANIWDTTKVQDDKCVYIFEKALPAYYQYLGKVMKVKEYGFNISLAGRDDIETLLYNSLG